MRGVSVGGLFRHFWRVKDADGVRQPRSPELKETIMTAQTITRRAKKSPSQAPTDGRPRWLSYPEAAELSTLSVRSLKRLTAAGKLPCYVVGGKVLRLKASDVEALFIPADECRGW